MNATRHDRSSDPNEQFEERLETLVAKVRAMPVPEESVERVRQFAARLETPAVSVDRRRWWRAVWGSVMAATAIALTISFVSLPKRLSAMERMADQLVVERSFSLKAVQRWETKADEPLLEEIVTRAYFLSRGTYRSELKTSAMELVDVRRADRPGILIDHKNKSYQRVPAERGTLGSPLMMFENLAKYRGQADRELGEKRIGNRTTHGFVVAMSKIDPDIKQGQGDVVVWIDDQSSLPLEIEYRYRHLDRTVALVMTEFVWDATLDPKLFEPTPPAGYVDLSPKESTTEEQFQKIREAMSLYAELSGGHYPKVKVIYGDMVSMEMMKLAGFGKVEEQLDAEEHGHPTVQRIGRATSGLAAMTLLQRQNEEAVYNGMSVGPKDRDKVLFRWKLTDGRFAVLFGDLKSEIVDKTRLNTLEKPNL